VESTIIHTGGKPVLLKVGIISQGPCILNMIGLDPTRKHSIYFDRIYGSKQEPFVGFKEFNFPMPISPGTLKLLVKPEMSSCHVEIKGYKKTVLKQSQLYLRPDEESFLKFAIEFVVKAGNLSPGMYHSDDSKFYINYLNDIIDYKTRKSENTPARISRATGYIEINRTKFLSYTIPMRLVILLHEFMHWRLKTRIELEADFNALNIFLKLGSSKTQALTAFTKVFHDTDNLVERVRKIKKFIERFPNLNPEK